MTAGASIGVRYACAAGADFARNQLVVRSGKGHDMRTVQELLGHRDLNTTMIYTHVLNRGPAGVQSPADRMSAL